MRSAGFSWRREFGRDAVARFLAVILGRWSGERGVSRFAYAHKVFTAASLLLVHTIVRSPPIEEDGLSSFRVGNSIEEKKVRHLEVSPSFPVTQSRTGDSGRLRTVHRGLGRSSDDQSAQ